VSKSRPDRNERGNEAPMVIGPRDLARSLRHLGALIRRAFHRRV
jgi:hypothetical protein